MQRKHPLAECEHCPLFFNGRFVPTEGPLEASLAIVGEAPGYYEAESGKPFQGPSGKLLNQVLKHNAIDRSEAMVSNACLCRPENNETPNKRAIEACRPRLIGELQSRGVSQVLALGNSACESLLDESGVTKLRVGRGRICKFDDNIEVIPALHPAAILRVPTNINQLVADVGKLNSPYAPWQDPDLEVFDTEESALAALQWLIELAPPKIACDIETHSEKDIDYGQPQQEGLLCIGICYAKGRVFDIGEQALNYDSVLMALKKFINSVPNVVWHNGKSDLKGMFEQVGLLRMTSDTLLMSYCLNEYSGPHKPHSLQYIGMELLGAPNWKSMLDRYQPRKYGYGVIPRNVLYKYNAIDCTVTFEVEEILRERCEAEDVLKVHDFLVEVSKELIFVEMNGIGINQEHLQVLSKDYGEQLDTLSTELDELLPTFGEEFYDTSKKATHLVNPNSPIQLKKVFRDFGLVLGTTDKEMLEHILASKGQESHVGMFIEKLLEHRTLAKQKGTYVDGIENRLYSGKVFSNFLLHGTTNGRLSSRNPNLQNIPRRVIIRRLFVPTRPGFVFIQGDYSQAELRALCWLSGDRYFTDIFNEGTRDVFTELSENVLFPEHKKETTSEELFKDLRVRVKAYVYGLAYGRTEYGIAREHGISVMEALRLKNLFFDVIPEIVQWQEWVKKEVENGNDLISPFGRHRRFPLITPDNHDDTMREALSFLPSSTSSDICLRAMCRVRRETRGIAFIRNIVHDSILVECHQSRVDEVKEILERHMLESAYEVVGDYIKFAIDTKVGPSWGDV